MEKMEVRSEELQYVIPASSTTVSASAGDANSSSVTIASSKPDNAFVSGISVAEDKTRWILNANHTKTCEACGETMFGWAYREKFAYCPKCGAKAEKAQ